MPEFPSELISILSELDHLLVEVPWPSLMISSDGTILAASRPMFELLDLVEGEVIGASAETFFLCDGSAAGHQPLYRRAASSPGQAVRGQLRRTGRASWPIAVEAIPIQGDSTGRMTLIVHPDLSLAQREQRLLASIRSAPDLLRARSVEELFARVMPALQPLGMHIVVALPEANQTSLRVRCTSLSPQSRALLERVAGAQLEDLPIPLERSAMRELYAAQAATLHPDPHAVLQQILPPAAALLCEALLRYQGVRCLLFAPLPLETVAQGMLVVWNPFLSLADVPLIEALAHQIAATLIQIDLRQRMEMQIQSLQRSRQRYRVLVEEATEAVIRLGADGNIRHLNLAAQRMIRANSEGPPQTLHDLLDPASAVEVQDRLARLIYHRPIEMPWITQFSGKNGHPLMLEMTAQVIRQGNAAPEVALVGRDVTRRLEAAANEQRQQRRLAGLLRVIEAVSHQLDLETLLREGMRALEDIGLVTMGGILLLDPSGSIFDLCAPLNVPSDIQARLTRLPVDRFTMLRATLSTGQPVLLDSARLRDYEDIFPGLGQLNLHNLVLMPLISGERRLGVLSLGLQHGLRFDEQDLQLLQAIGNQLAQATAKAQVYQTLQETAATNAQSYREAEAGKSYLNALIHNTPDILLTLDQHMAVHLLNPARLTALAGHVQGEVEGQSILNFIPRPRHQELVSRWQTILAGQPQSLEIDILRANGTPLTALLSAALIPEYQQVFVIIKDVTEQKQLEAQMRQTEKLAALGRLIAGAAHEINNPLAAILGLVQLQIMEDLPPTLRADMESIERATLRVQHIVQQLRTFAQPQLPQYQPISLPSLAEVTLARLMPDCAAYGVEVFVDLPPGLPPALGDPHQIEQVLFNIFNNSIQALSTNSDSMPRRLAIWGWGQRQMVHLAINDTGPGIAPEHLSRIFDPFFTTRAVGQGTGLGLSIVHAIVQQHGGRIWPESRLGYGTTFHLDLPIAPSAGRPGLAEQHAPPKLPVGLRILLVEDDAAVRSVIARALTHLNCAVDAFGSGEEAWEHAQQQTYSLVISDLQMPGLDGPALYERLHQDQPTLRWLILTGDTMGEQSQAFLDRTGLPVLLKPFTHDQLLKQIVESLTV